MLKEPWRNKNPVSYNTNAKYILKNFNNFKLKLIRWFFSIRINFHRNEKNSIIADTQCNKNVFSRSFNIWSFLRGLFI